MRNPECKVCGEMTAKGFDSVKFVTTYSCRHCEDNPEKQQLKAWYQANYSDDDLGKSINPTATFFDLFNALDRRKDIYKFLNVSDSIIRERLFGQLSEIMKAPYEEIYQQWLMATNNQ